MPAATLIRESLPGFNGHASLYRLTPGHPENGAEYVIVSAVDAPFTGPETYIFPATATGEIIRWGELDGSYRGGFSHEEALRRAGYEITR